MVYGIIYISIIIIIITLYNKQWTSLSAIAVSLIYTYKPAGSALS
jgi:hypothetical protein